MHRLPNVRQAPLPSFIRPQLATLVDEVPRGDDWLHEIKLDGYRALCRIDKGRAAFFTREGNDWTSRFGALAEIASKFHVRQALLDGEVVVIQDDGSTSFQALQNAQNNGERLVYFGFDLLHVDGYDLTRAPLLERKRVLAGVVPPGERQRIRLSDHVVGQGEAFFNNACRLNLEGVISKRKDGPYKSGRTHDWLKVKCLLRQEFVIGGFTDPSGSRVGLGALLLGVYNDRGDLVYAGRVGTGFSSASLNALRARLNRLEEKSAPFSNPPTGAAARGAHWVRPELVGEVAFTSWTRDGILRHPSFQGLREDKPAASIRRERPLIL